MSWARVLEDLAGTLPEGVWLTSLSLQPPAAGTTAAPAAPAAATAAPAAEAGAAPTAPAPVVDSTLGTASFGATALDFADVANWLDRLPRLPYFLNLSVSTANKTGGGPRPLVTFTSGAKIGPAVRSDRLQRTLAPPL